MSKTIDQKVVEMRFDNKNFEDNVQTSISSLDRLKQSLKLEDASKGLKEVEDQAKKVDVSGIGTAIETVKLKFSAFEVMAITALSNITNSALNTGKQLVKSLSVDNISAGWTKFGEKTTSVGTLVAQGYDLDTVNKQLERLNWFTDETSYNFTDMVANIAKFTASGQDLDKSVTALEGIANWAALSGQNATTASRAMYQLSQAMGAGVMRKEDYKSIQNVSMDTDEFRQKALDAGVALGTLKKNADGTYKSLVGAGEAFTKAQFAEHLTEERWFTSDVMMRVYNDYSKAVGEIYEYVEKNGGTASEAIEKLGDSVDQFGLKAFKAAQEARTWGDVVDSVKDAVSTGWMTTFEMLFGNYEEAKVLFTDLANELYDIFAEGGNERNRLLKEWKTKGGRDDLIEALWNVIHGIEAIIQPVKDAFRDIFPKKTADELLSITKRIKEFTEKLILSDETSEKLRRTFKGLFSILDIAKTIFGKLIGALKPVIQLLKPTKDGVLDVTASFGDWLVKLSESIKVSERVEKVFNKLKDVIQVVVDFLRTFVSSAKSSFGEGGLTGVIKVLFDKLGDVFGLITDIISKLTGKDLSKFKDKVISGINTIRDNVVEFVEKVKEKFEIQNGIFDSFKNSLKSVLDKIKDIFKGFKDVDFSGIDDLSNKTDKAFKPVISVFDAIKKILSVSWEIIKKLAPVIGTVISKIAKAIGDVFSKIGNIIKSSDTQEIMDLVNGGVLIAIGIGIKKLIDSAKGIFDKIGTFKDSFTGIIDGLKNVLNGVKDTLVAYQKEVKAKALLKIAAAVGILALSIVVLASIDPDDLFKAIAAISALFAELTVTMKAISKIDTISVSNTAFLIGFALAILVLSSAIKKIASMSIGDLAKGFGGITAISILMVAVAKTLSKNESQMMKGITSLILFAIAIRLLIKPIQKLGKMPFLDLLQGIVSLTVLVGLMIGVAVIMKKYAGEFAKSAVSLIIFAESIRLMIKPVQKLGEMPFLDLLQGVVSLTVLIGLMVGVAVIMKKHAGTFAKAAVSLIIFAESIRLIIKPVQKLGEMPFLDLLQGIVSLTVLIGLMIGVAVIMKKHAGTFAKSAASLILFAVAIQLLVKPIQELGEMPFLDLLQGMVSLTALIALIIGATKILGKESSNIIKASAGLLLFSAALAVMVPVFKVIGSMSLADVGTALLAIAGVFIILGAAGYVLAPVVPVIDKLSTSLLKIGAAAILAGAGLVLISTGLTLMSASTEVAINAIISIIIALIVAIPNMLKALAVSLTDSIVSIVDMIVVIGKAILDALRQLVPDIVETALVLVSEILISIAGHIPQIVESLLDIIAGIIVGLAKGLPKVVSAIAELVTAIIKSIGDAFKGADFGSLILSLLEGIAFVTLLTVFMGLLMAVTVLAVATTVMLPLIAENLNKFITTAEPFITAISKIDPAVLAGAKNLAEMILILTAASILDAMTSWFTGKDSFVKFGKEISEFAPYLAKYYKAIRGVNGKVVESSANAAKALTEVANNLPRSGGIKQWISGSSSLSKFAQELSDFGPQLKKYANSVVGLDSNLVINSARAAMAISELANNLPNSGGLIAKIFGENSLSDFAKGLAEFGPKLKEYSDSVAGLDPDLVINSANAAMALSELASNLPNSGGAISWILGDNTLSAFANELAAFGPAFKAYADSVAGIENLDALNVSTEAAKALVEMAQEVPNSGGVVSWFAGDNLLSVFAEELAAFGPKFAEYVGQVSGLTAEEIETTKKTAEAAFALAQMANEVPNTGGLVQWFTGEASLKKFAEGLSDFGPAFKTYVENVSGITNDDLETAKKTSEVGLTLAQMADAIPNTGGAAQWFTGEGSLKDFAEGLKEFADPFKEYIGFVKGLTNDELDIAQKASNVALTMAQAAGEIPNEGGIVSWFTGDNSLSKFAKGLSDFIPKFKEYVSQTATVKDSAYVKAGKAAEIALSLAKMAGEIPNEGGIASWFTGDATLSDFAAGLKAFAPDFVSFINTISSLTDESIQKAEPVVQNAMDMANIAAKLEEYEIDSDSFEELSEGLGFLSPAFKAFVEDLFYLNLSRISDAIDSINSIVSMMSGMNSLDYDSVTGFSDALGTIGESGIDAFLDSFEGAKDKIDKSVGLFINSAKRSFSEGRGTLIDANGNILDGIITKFNSYKNKFYTKAKELIIQFISGIKSQHQSAITAASDITSSVLSELSSYSVYTSSYNSGIQAANGFINALDDSAKKVMNHSAAFARASTRGLELELDINSPSKAWYQDGVYSGIGFINALDDYSEKAEKSAYRFGKSAENGLKEGINKAIDMINSDDFDTSLHIKPVLDLDELQNGRNKMNSMLSGFNGYSVDVAMDSARAISGLYSSGNSIDGDEKETIQMPGGTSITQNNYYVNPHSNYELYKSEKNLEKEIERISSKRR